MSGLGDVPNWISALAGTFAGAGVTMLRDAVQGRSRLELRLSDLQERAWIVQESRAWKVATPEAATELIITVDVLLINHSTRDNSVASVRLLAPPDHSFGIPGSPYLNEAFGGVNVPAHSLVRQRLRFSLKRGQHPYADLARWKDQSASFAARLTFEAVRGKSKSLDLQVGELRVSNQPEDDASFLFTH